MQNGRPVSGWPSAWPHFAAVNFRVAQGKAKSRREAKLARTCAWQSAACEAKIIQLTKLPVPMELVQYSALPLYLPRHAKGILLLLWYIPGHVRAKHDSSADIVCHTRTC